MRRAAIGAVFVCVVLFAGYLARGGNDAEPLPGTALRELAKQRGIELGTAVRGDVQKRNRAYRQVTAAQFSTVTPENEMKWYAVEPEQGEYAFDGADAIVEQAREAQQKVRGHTLVWHAQLPAWVKALGPSGLRQAMREHIRRVMAQ